VTFKSVLSFDFTRTCELKPLFGTGFCFHLWHFSSLYIEPILWLPTYFFEFLGAMNIVIRFPSSFGICSTLPNSSNSCAKRKSSISP